MEHDLERGEGGRMILAGTTAVRPRGGGGGVGGAGVGDGGGGGGRRRGGHIIRIWVHGLLFILIQIKYQERGNSPFETHPLVMTSSLIASCVYGCSVLLQIILVQTNNELDDPRLLNHVIVYSGILSSLSNAVVFLPNNVGWIVVVLFVLDTIILLAYDVFKLITNYISEGNNNNVNATPTPETVALEMSTGINHNAATTSESMEMSTRIDSNESSSNNNDAIEMRTENNFTGSTHTPFHSFLNQAGFGD